MRLGLLGLLGILMVSGCVTTERQSPPSSLRNTEWVLIGVQDEPSGAALKEVTLYAYTLRLDASGQAHFKLDCNTGTGTWQARPAADGKGSLTFGQLAVTAALCGAGSIGERLAADMGEVTSYSIYDGRLTLGLEDSGRTYVWDSVD